MRFLVLLVGVAVLFVIVGPVLVLPAVAGDADACAKGTGDEKIEACTRSINFGLWRVLTSLGPTPTGVPRTVPRANPTARLRTTKGPSGSTRSSPMPTMDGATLNDGSGDRDSAIADFDQASAPD